MKRKVNQKNIKLQTICYNNEGQQVNLICFSGLRLIIEGQAQRQELLQKGYAYRRAAEK